MIFRILLYLFISPFVLVVIALHFPTKNKVLFSLLPIQIIEEKERENLSLLILFL